MFKNETQKKSSYCKYLISCYKKLNIIMAFCFIAYANSFFAMKDNESFAKNILDENINVPENLLPDYANILKNVPSYDFDERYKSPTKSKLMLQDPELSKSFVEFAYKENVCPDRIREIVRLYLITGKKAFFKKHYAILLPRLIILHGPHGTGKSTLGVLIANQLKKKIEDMKYVFINSGFLGSMYRKSEEVNLGEKIAPLLEKGIPCVVIIDEADAVVGAGENKSQNLNRGRATAIGQMIDMLRKKPNFILVWTTNHIDDIGKKFKDQCGVEDKIEVPLPNLKKRTLIFDFMMNETREIKNKYEKFIFAKNCTAENLARLSENFSLRQMEDMMRSALNKAMIRYSENDEKNSENDEKKELENPKQKVFILLLEDFINISNLIKNDMSKNKKSSRWKTIKKFVKEHQVLASVLSTTSIFSSSSLFYFLNKKDNEKNREEQRKREDDREARDRKHSWSQTFVSILLPRFLDWAGEKTKPEVPSFFEY